MIELNYHHLYYFYVVATEGSIAKACKKLYLAPPTISTQLSQFEASLRKKLFDRRDRRLILTHEGRVVLRYAELIFRLGRELAEHVQQGKLVPAQSLRIGVAEGMPKALTHAALRSVLDAHPQARVACVELPLDQLLEQLGDFKLDIALTDAAAAGERQDRFVSRLIGRVPVLFVGVPDLVRRGIPTARALDGAPLILQKAPAEINRQVRRYLAENRVRSRVVAEVPDAEIAWRLAASGHGLAPLDVHSFAANRAYHKLDVVGRGQRTGLSLEVFLVVCAEALVANPLAATLLESLRLPKAAPRQ